MGIGGWPGRRSWEVWEKLSEITEKIVSEMGVLGGIVETSRLEDG